jgi:hypothetical protein
MEPPKARDQDLIVAEVDDELVVYDKSRDRAHHLNPVASLVWTHCDGRTSIPELTALIQARFGASLDESATWLALRQLDRARLLTGPLAVPDRYRGLTRRDALKGVASAGAVAVGAAAAVSLVTSLNAPKAYAAASCAMATQSCAILPCCAGLTCLPVVKTCA